MDMELKFDSILEFDKLSLKISKLLNHDDIVLLSGDLGAGKTTLVKYIIKHLGGNIDEVISPTFNIVQEYYVNGQKIYHLDLYRLKNVFDLEEIGIEEILNDGLVFIEWPDLVRSMVDSYHDINILDDKLIYNKVA